MDMMILLQMMLEEKKSKFTYDSEHTSDPKSGEGNLHCPVLLIASL
jgi:hypothetical protein